MTFKPLYYFSKVLFNVTIRTFYSDIKVRGKENLCPGKPVIIAMNHPNAFMDPIAFATIIGPEMNFLARGDAFTKLLTPILKGVGIIPIYRLIDSGREGVQKNDETFKIVTQYLKDRRYVIIFAEGISLHGRRLNNLKKGCARIVLGAMESLNDEEIRVVPVGMNYQNDPSKFRHKLFINIGEPIFVRDYREKFSGNAARAINDFTLDLQQRMRSTVIHINDKSNDEIVKWIEEIYLEEYLEENGFKIKNLEQAHVFTGKVVKSINELAATATDRLENIRSSINDYVSSLNQIGIRDKLIRKKYHHLSEAPSLLIRTFLFLFGIPVWLVGMLTNYIPYLICWKIPRKLAKDIEWFAALAGSVGTFVFLFYHSLQFLIFWILTDSAYYLAIYIIVTFLSGWFCLHYSPFRKKLLGSLRLFRFRKDVENFQSLILK
jgi:glycerol-3-phosphate O-acyltransferase / dihydroxyacetone phosphate acyltransferase